MCAEKCGGGGEGLLINTVPSSATITSRERSRHSYRLRFGHPRFDSRQVQEILLFFATSAPDLGPNQLPLQLVPGVKRQGRGTDHSPPSCVEVKNGGAILQYLICLHGFVLYSLNAGSDVPCPSDS
jgi:hypothetical protein